MGRGRRIKRRPATQAILQSNHYRPPDVLDQLDFGPVYLSPISLPSLTRRKKEWKQETEDWKTGMMEEWNKQELE